MSVLRTKLRHSSVITQMQCTVSGQPISELFMKVMWRLSEGASSLVPARLSLPNPVTSL